MVLLDEDNSKMGLSLPYKNTMVHVNTCYCNTDSRPCYTLKGDDKAVVTFRLELSPDQYLEQSFAFAGNSYRVNGSWKAIGMEEYMGKQSNAAFAWDLTMKDIEADNKTNMAKSTINYYLASKALDSLKENAKELKKKRLNAP